MWVCLNNSFLSIVQPSKHELSKFGKVNETLDLLLVRARRPGDLEAVFGDDVVVHEVEGRDYQFRAYIPRSEVAMALVNQVGLVDYPNFKNSVADDKLHKAYASFWHQHAGLQPRAPYSYRHGGYKPQSRLMPQYGGTAKARSAQREFDDSMM